MLKFLTRLALLKKGYDWWRNRKGGKSEIHHRNKSQTF